MASIEFAPNKQGQLPTSTSSIWSTTQSEQQLVEVSTKKAYLQRRPTRRRIECSLTVSIILLAIVASILIFVTVYYFKLKDQIGSLCLSAQCIHSASSLLSSMDKSTHPCDDFFQFVCGNWHQEHPIPQTSVNTDWFTERSDRAISAITYFLQKNDSDSEPEAVHQSRTMYRACLDTETLEELGLQPLSDILEEIGLTLVPSVNESSYYSDVSISRMIALAKVSTTKDLFLHAGVYADVFNRTNNKITVAVPESKSMLPSHKGRNARHRTVENKLRKALVGGDVHVIKSWRRYINMVVKYIYTENNVTVTDEEFQNVTNKILDMGLHVQKLLTDKNISGEEIEKPDSMSLSELQNLTDAAATAYKLEPKIDWREYLQTAFDNANTTVDLDEEEIYVYGIDYYKSISKILANHTEYEIALGMWWELVYTLTPYANEDLRTMRNIFLTEALGEPSPLPRESYCAVAIWSIMDIAIASAAADEYPQVEKTKKEVNEMIDNIQSSFYYYVSNAQWIDAETKKAIIEKGKVIRRNIGFPEWVMNKEDIDLYYENLTVTEDEHMYNFLRVVQMANKNMYATLYTINNYTSAEFDPREVNALYIPQENSITIPLGMLQFPFFHTGLDALNYGSLGSIIGHELTHAFDITGRKYDKDGNVNQWWTNSTIEKYTERISCFIKQYDDYWIEDAEEYLNGTLTLGENLADNGGLKDAYFGFQRRKEEKGYQEKYLPGLEEYSTNQMFYIGFAHEWCENWTPKSIKWGLGDEHAPNYIRVMASVSNSKDFAEVWKCPKQTEMNPNTKCQLW
ncbi:neprilysin-11 [Nilaparvata lugens]|uniref:neprilysin-11 n=2 Tax=Nilaparvata lugens TaxID=108931 RepID=UPI00193DE58B|nr:neprilysin-11 [Nilaparvata lugens]XP_039293425.1 neprilysin-11 [Nilaparvata lugens]XP_039293426.1 neprilysin-11 [Nilaparvata lugens]XP_039293427.1 neprilysin-11 [Nilaparvata lugens]XP_039293428.1 neprilysin-11 [Nilaparvata lugens]